MRLPKLRYVTLSAVIVGVVIPLFLMAASWLNLMDFGDWLIYVWPTAFMLMATESLGHSAAAFEILALSIAYNVVIYAAAFIFVWSVCWVLQAWRRSLRDGTTI